MTGPTSRALELAGSGEFKQLRALFAPAQRRRITVQALSAAWAQHVTSNGPIEWLGDEVQHGLDYSRRLHTAARELNLVVSTDQDGRLTNIQVTPVVEPWSLPDYANPDSFDEVDTPGGTIALPHGTGPFPTAVLLGGGGPFDRDLTMGANKIGRDLAWGLASRGVASIRFDKPKAAATPTDEYLPAVRAAIAALRSVTRIGPIVLVGHSMGATIAPRIALAEPGIAGLVLLAGQAQPMHEAAVRTFRYLASLDDSPQLRASVQAVERQAAEVASKRLSARTPPRKLPFGYTGSWWLDLRDYDPVATARGLAQPLLLLQGGRDYQVTVADDLDRWMTGLAGRAGVTSRVYPDDNHLFFAGGSGRSRPSEYDPPQHVDVRVIDDIAGWVREL